MEQGSPPSMSSAITPMPEPPTWRDRLHLLFADHGLLRVVWHNEAEIAPGVWRANQPGPRRLTRWRARGIHSVLSLRGQQDAAAARIEQAACAELGLELSTTRLSATTAPRREVLLDLLARFRSIRHPFVMHCKSGADRTGLAAALYLMAIEGQPWTQARSQLSLRWMHGKWTRAGILDLLFETHDARQAHGAIGIEEWLATEYDPARLTRDFARLRGRA